MELKETFWERSLRIIVLENVLERVHTKSLHKISKMIFYSLIIKVCICKCQELEWSGFESIINKNNYKYDQANAWFHNNTLRFFFYFIFTIDNLGVMKKTISRRMVILAQWRRIERDRVSELLPLGRHFLRFRFEV